MKNHIMTNIRWLVAGALLSFGSASYGDYSQHSEAIPFIEKMVSEHGFEKRYVVDLLKNVTKKQAILDAISRPAEKTKPWHEYRKIFVEPKRIAQGVAFWEENEETLTRAEAHFGVPSEIIVAIIGVETRYGKHAGKYRVIDALTTLGFDYPKRAAFFRSQLEHFLLMTREQKQDPLSLYGSYAGAMGYGQFIPSSFRTYAIDFDEDGTKDIWKNRVDAIGSVANYFLAHRWRQGEDIGTLAKATENADHSITNSKKKPSMSIASLIESGFSPVDGAVEKTRVATPIMLEQEDALEYWLGFNNFYVITRYNHSHLYAMAVWQLSEEVAKARSKVKKSESS